MYGTVLALAPLRRRFGGCPQKLHRANGDHRDEDEWIPHELPPRCGHVIALSIITPPTNAGRARQRFSSSRRSGATLICPLTTRPKSRVSAGPLEVPPLRLKHTPKTDGASRTRPEPD